MPNYQNFTSLSPRVILNEIDESTLPPVPSADGILLIGRARSGPAMKPITINSMNDFTEIFGQPINGQRQADAWRNGNTGAPNYAAYAAQAYLAAGTGPVKYVRLLGVQKNTSNKAGWTIGSTFSRTVTSNKSAYGIFVMPSGSLVTGTLAAIVYTNGAGIGLTGSVVNPARYGAGNQASASVVYYNNTSNAGFQLVLDSCNPGQVAPIVQEIDFSPTSPNYIRTVLNTDPTLLKNASNYGGGDYFYFLGETFDVNVQRLITSISGSDTGVLGFIMGLDDGTTGFGDFQQELKPGKTGWFIGQRPDQKQLFRLVALDDGEEFQKIYYARVRGIVLATAIDPRAKFTLDIMKRNNSGEDWTMETHGGLTLDPEDPINYIEKRIGSQDKGWDWTLGIEKYTNNGGNEPNISKYVRVEMASAGGLPTKDLVPMGFLGPAAVDDILFQIGDPADILGGGNPTNGVDVWSTDTRAKWINGNIDIFNGNESALLQGFLMGWPEDNCTGSIRWPKIGLTENDTKNGSDFGANDVFGLWHKKTNELIHDPSFGDIAKRRSAFDPNLADGLSRRDYVSASFVFTLDDIVSSSNGATTYYFLSGAYDNALGAGPVAPPSISKHHGLAGSTGLIDGVGIKAFAAPFIGGADGVDIRYADPFSNARIGNAADGYPSYTVDQAIKMVADQEQIRYELISMPGLVNESKLQTLLANTTLRADALAIVDIEGIYQPIYDTESTEVTVNLDTVITKRGSLLYQGSYGATYFPSIYIKDTFSGVRFKTPPSVAGIGAIAKSEALSQPWFAPAGFNRGGLGILGGPGGPAVPGTTTHLTRAERDKLYQAQINPIARFPSTGDTVIFGQKTLLTAHSALDRINVRRLLIYLKRQIGVIADTILFDPNVQVTWNRFKTRAEAVLSEVKTELGLVDYKVILDSSTTDAAAIDNNVMYAQILVKPARAIEYIVVDFIITQTGVEF